MPALVKQNQIDIHFEQTGNHYFVSEETDLSEMQYYCPKFFRTPHGKREAFAIYRGQLIVRNTVTFTGCKPTRRTTVYLFVLNMENHPDLFCISTGNQVNSIRQAERLIDRVLDNRLYKFNLDE